MLSVVGRGPYPSEDATEHYLKDTVDQLWQINGRGAACGLASWGHRADSKEKLEPTSFKRLLFVIVTGSQ